MSAAARRPPAGTERFGAWLLLITLGGLLLRAAWLLGPPILADDLAAGASAVNFVERGQIGPTMWQHPRLRDLLVYLSELVLGPSRLGLVAASLVLGAVAVPAVGLLTRRLATPRAALLAATLLAIDPLHVDYSRQAVQDVYTATFGALGVLTTLRAIDTRRGSWLVLAGSIFGLGLASKWSVAFPHAVCAAFALVEASRHDVGPFPGLRRANVSLVLAALVLLPLAVYLATWTPWFAGGRDLGDWARLQAAMAREATSHAGFNLADAQMPHRALLWFVWPAYYADSALGGDGPAPIVAMSHPLTWLLVLPAAAWLSHRAWRRRSTEGALLPTLVLAGWLPFAATARPIWLHSALAVLPFALSAVAVALDGVASGLAHGRRLLAAYAAAALIVGAPLYLLAAGVAAKVPVLRDVALTFRPVPRSGATP